MRDVTLELKQLRLYGMAGAWIDLAEQGGPASLEASRWLVEQLAELSFTDAAHNAVFIGGPDPAT